MKERLIKKFGLPVLVVSSLIVYATPAYAWSSVSAYASITFSNKISYYYAKGTGKVYASGSNSGYQALENFSFFTREGEVIDDDTLREGKSPVIINFQSDKEGDKIQWGLSTYGYLYDEGVEIDSAQDHDSVEHPGI
ncbi:hypothetical protein [Brevibacillus borstelensis]|uniref:hypothetical protein n=1 Tax=Brevibacillus borstelensis TaxID=45462 RepID=UPI0030BF5232